MDALTVLATEVTTVTQMPDAVTNGVAFMIEQAIVVIGIVTSNIVLSLGIAMWICGGGIGLFKRLV